MQRIYLCNLTPEEYVANQAHRQIRPEEICPLCGGCDCLQGHGNYGRGITLVVLPQLSQETSR